jgi:DNA-binding LacI/PurR family transcriptional regulator
MKKRITSQDVAQSAGVSRTTVSLVLNNVPGIRISETTRQRVIDAARDLNYHADISGRKLVSGNSNTLGLVLLQSPEQIFADALLPQILLGVEQAITNRGFQVLVKPVEPDNKRGYVHLIDENHVDGIILSGPLRDDSEIVQLHENGLPIMLIGQLPDTNIPSVDIDAIAGATSAVQHLISLGHQRIAMITNSSLEYTSAQQRYSGYQKAMQEAGLDLQAGYLREGNYTPGSGYDSMNDLLNESPLPTAVFVASDTVALGAILAIKQKGYRIPEDIAVVGFDDIPLSAYFDPPLTSVRIPSYGIGMVAGERLVRLVKHENLEETNVLLESELIIRQSSFKNSEKK